MHQGGGPAQTPGGWERLLDEGLVDGRVNIVHGNDLSDALLDRLVAAGATFSCRQMAKDMDLVLGAARVTDVPVPLAALMRQSYAALIACGDGEADFIATVRHAERLAGLARRGEET